MTFHQIEKQVRDGKPVLIGEHTYWPSLLKAKLHAENGRFGHIAYYIDGRGNMKQWRF